LGFTFAPGLDAGAFETICPVPDGAADDAFVVAFLGFPLDSFRVSLAMTASCAGLSVAKTITSAFGSKAGALFRRLEIYTGTNHSLTR
jgi:hypothetical protein